MAALVFLPPQRNSTGQRIILVVYHIPRLRFIIPLLQICRITKILLEMDPQRGKADVKANMNTGIILDRHPFLKINAPIDIKATMWTANTRETVRIMKTVRKIEWGEIVGLVDVMSNSITKDTLRVSNFLDIDPLGNHPSIRIADLIDTAVNDMICF